MRLDHLLSKEHNILVGLVCSRVLDTGFARGWNIAFSFLASRCGGVAEHTVGFWGSKSFGLFILLFAWRVMMNDRWWLF